jgi:hypothetical protein
MKIFFAVIILLAFVQLVVLAGSLARIADAFEAWQKQLED